MSRPLNLCLLLASSASSHVHFSWIFALTAGPTFYISALNLSVQRLLKDIRVATIPATIFRPSSRAYIITTLSIDGLTLFFTIIGAAYAGARASRSAEAAQAGFDIMTAAMAIQLVSVTIMILVTLEVTVSVFRHKSSGSTATPLACSKLFKSFAIGEWRAALNKFSLNHHLTGFESGLVFFGALLFARTVVRAVGTAGGFNGSLQGFVIANVESILMFVALLFMIPLHPAIALRDAVQEPSAVHSYV